MPWLNKSNLMKCDTPFSLQTMTPKINTSPMRELGPAMWALIGFNGLEQLHLRPPPTHPLPIAPYKLRARRLLLV